MKRLNILFSIFISSIAYGDDLDCAKVLTNSSKRCDKLKISLDLSKCDAAPQKKLPLIPKCEINSPYAEGTTPTHTYRVKINKKENTSAWGGGSPTWKASSSVDRKLRKEPQREIASIKPNEPIPAVVADTGKEVVAKISGFVDAQFVKSTRQSMNRGFLLNDGAIYVTSELKEVEFKVDIPFRMYTVGNPNFEVGLTRAQAYVGQKLASGFKWKIGQFDTTFGFEGNDTVDITFSRQGNVYNYTDPFVHTGLFFGYDFSPELNLNFYVANPNDRGVSTNKNLQYGAQLVRSASDFRFAIGGMLNADSTTGKTNYYADVVTGVTVGGLSVDAEASYNYRSDIINPDTGTGINGIGALLHIVYQFSEPFTFGARGEYITQQALADPKETAPQSTLKSQVLIFAGPQYYITKNIRLKLDYSLQMDTEYGSSTAQLSHGLQIGSILRF